MNFIKSFRLPLSILVVFWLIEVLDQVFVLHLDTQGLIPRSISGLKGILTAPFLHGGFRHLLSNTLPFLILGATIRLFYKPISLRVYVFIYLLTGIGVWLFGRNAVHIGASGVIYGFAGFLMFMGIFRLKLKEILISIIVIGFYWSMIFGIFPTKQAISWESHLVGFITGIFGAFLFRKNKKLIH